MLPLCLGVARLTCWISPPEYKPRLGPLITQLRPTWLSARLRHLLNPGSPDLSNPFFSKITHLEIIDEEWYGWSGYDQLSCLTHFRARLPYSDADVDGIMHQLVVSVESILDRCPNLEVCVVEHLRSSRLEPNLPQHNPLRLQGIADDPRLVHILQSEDLLSDWQAFISGQPDTWDFVEARVAEQRKTRCSLPASEVYSSVRWW